LTGHLSQNQIEEYGRQKLSAAELLSVSDHLSECETCRRLLERAVEADAAFFAMRSELFGDAAIALPPAQWAHPTVEEMAGYVDGTLASEEMQVVTDHLTRCERCVLAVDDLRAFSNQAAPTLDREYYPATVPVSTQSRWPRLAAFVPPSFLKSPALAFGAVVLLLAGSGWVIWQALQKEDATQETVATTPSRTIPPPAPNTPGVSSAPPPVIAELHDGERQVVLYRDGTLLGADDLPPDYRTLVKEALAGRQLEKSPLLAGLRRRESSLMGDKQVGELFVVEPIGKVLIADRPAFRWSTLDGAANYVVEVYDERFNLVATSGEVTTNSWTAPRPLSRGVVYSWQVRAIKDGKEFSSPHPPAPQAKFRILDQVKANELVEARRAFASSHLTLGLLYAQAGLLDEAEQELRSLQKGNPNSALVLQLLANVQAMRR